MFNPDPSQLSLVVKITMSILTLSFFFWLDCCLELFHDNDKTDLVVLITKDSCDGSRLNTSENSKDSHS